MFYQSHTIRLPGLLSVAALTLLSYSITSLPWFAHIGINSMVVAIVIGILIGNTLHLPATLTPGIQFAAKQLLRLAIMLYGFRVSLQEIAAVGLHALLLDAAVVSLTLFLGYLVGTRILKLDKQLALLISTGAAICGAAAVLAAEDVIQSEPYKAAVAIGTVVLFGTISMFLYPAMQHAGMFGLSDAQFGIFAGASVHEVAQALVTGSSISLEIGKTAVVVKMIRVLMLIPVLMVLSVWNPTSTKAIERKKKVMIPWFAIGFLLVIMFHSLQLLPTPLVTTVNQLDMVLLTMAMGAIGLETKFSKIKKVGWNPLYLAMIIFVWLMCFTALAVKMI